MSTTRTFDAPFVDAQFADAEFVHIPPRPDQARHVRNRDSFEPGEALAAALGEASLVGMATLGFTWGLAELAFVLLGR